MMIAVMMFIDLCLYVLYMVGYGTWFCFHSHTYTCAWVLRFRISCFFVDAGR